jgi:hypothetical protein
MRDLVWVGSSLDDYKARLRLAEKIDAERRHLQRKEENT